jgi:hypothetical protein
MSWDNYGKVWHIDHIIPCAAFNHENQEEVNRCWNYKNYSPEFIHCNERKSDQLETGESARILKREDPARLKQIVNTMLVKIGLEILP